MTKACATCIRLAKAMREHGFTLQRLGNLLNLHPSALSRRLSGKTPPARKPTTRAPSKAMQKRRAQIEKAIRSPTLEVKLAPEVKRTLKLNVSVSTVRRDIIAGGGKLYRMQRGPIWEAGDPSLRAKWVEEQLKDENFGRNSVYCDEKLFGLSAKGIKSEYCYPGQQRRTRNVAHTPMINVFAAVGPGGKIFIKIIPKAEALGPKHHRYVERAAKKNPNERRGRKRKPLNQLKLLNKPRKGMDSEAFIDHILKPLIRAFPRKHYKLIVDNATPHVSKLTSNWCKSKQITLVRLPPRSPDINIVENFWAALEQAVWRLGRPKDLKELEKRILECAKNIDVSHLYETARPRAAEVLHLRGKLLDGRWRKPAARRNEKHLLSLA